MKSRKLMLCTEKSLPGLRGPKPCFWGAGLRRAALMITAAILAGWHAPTAPAANIAVKNVTQCDAEAGQRFVQFDVSWDASWRASWTETNISPMATHSVTNWDAAWIFVKYRPAGETGAWSRATLSTNNGAHVAPAGSTINVGLSVNTNSGASFGAGVFFCRSENGSGPWTNKGVKLRWQSADDGVANAARVDVCVRAIEMVYVPEGAFWLGSGGTESGHFIEGYGNNASNNAPFHVRTEGQISVSNQPGCLWGVSTNGDSTIGPEGILPNAFPKGYHAFYCMKYEVSQGQYADFLNHLGYTQAKNRCPGGSVDYRYTISGIYPNYSAEAPTRACSYLTWADGAAYADWTGLRPMTELEYEKAGRGPLYPVANEYAWGNTTIVMTTNFHGNDGSGKETALPENANACYGGTYIRGPVRGGLFATASSGRQAAGASYWGIMELGGNVWERPVAVGRPEGRAFTGAHGDGELNVNGDADVIAWPGTRSVGAGYRGGSWYSSAIYLRTSDRVFAASSYNIIRPWILFDGWRAVRSAPGVN